MKKEYSRIIYEALAAVGYKGPEDNKRLRAAIDDFSAEFPQERKLFLRNADDSFLQICSTLTAGDNTKLETVKRKASQYIQDEYHVVSSSADAMAGACVDAFAGYLLPQMPIEAHGEDEPINAEEHPKNDRVRQPVKGKELLRYIGVFVLSAAMIVLLFIRRVEGEVGGAATITILFFTNYTGILFGSLASITDQRDKTDTLYPFAKSRIVLIAFSLIAVYAAELAAMVILYKIDYFDDLESEAPALILVFILVLFPPVITYSVSRSACRRCIDTAERRSVNRKEMILCCEAEVLSLILIFGLAYSDFNENYWPTLILACMIPLTAMINRRISGCDALRRIAKTYSAAEVPVIGARSGVIRILFYILLAFASAGILISAFLEGVP